MNGELDELAQAAAGVLVAALASDSAEAAEHWFAGVIGQERRLSATRAELAAAVGPSRAQVAQAAVTTWAYRLRDILEENPAVALPLRAVVAAQRQEAAPAPPAPAPPAPVPAAPVPPAPVPAAPSVPGGPPGGAYPDLVGRPQAPAEAPFSPSPRRKPTGAVAAITAVAVIAVAALVGWQAHWPPALFPAASPVLPAGTSTVSIKSTSITMTRDSQGRPTGPIDGQGNLVAQKEQGTIDGLVLTGTGGFDLAQFSLPSQTSPVCDGESGLESTGTLGGTAYHVVMTCVPSAQQNPANYTQSYTGEWGSRPIHMTATISSATESRAQLSGTIGSQQVTATINLTPGGYEGGGTPPPGTLENIESGTITVS
jgi:hypothetical protein